MSIRNRTTRRGLALLVAILLLPATLFAGAAGAASHTNNTPYFADIPVHNVTEKHTLRFFVAAYDEDGDLLLYGAQNLPDGARFDSARRLFSWTPGYDQQGTHVVTFTATDGRATGSVNATIEVINHNFGPVAEDVDASALAGRVATLQLVASDFDKDALTFASDEVFDNATLDAATGIVTFAPSVDQVGVHTMNFTVSDGELNATGRLTVNVTSNSPVVIENAAATIRANGTVELQLVAADPEGAEVAFASEELPEGATLDAAGLFTWTTSFEDVGVRVINFTASDEVQAANGTITVTVTANGIPQIAPVDTPTVIANRTVVVQLLATDPEGENLTFSAGRIPAGATLDEAGRFTWTPQAADIGVHDMTFNVTDGESTAEGLFSVNVVANPAPVIASLFVPAKTDVFTPVKVRVVASDPEGTNLTIEWDFDYDGSFLTMATGDQPSHAFTRIGEHTVAVRVTDADGSRTIKTATILVDDAVLLTLEVLEAPGDVFTSTFARATLTTWNGTAIAGAQIDLVSFHLPGTGSATTMREFKVTTGADGTIEFFIPRDTAVANLVGNHLLRGTVTVGTGADAEIGFHTVRYVIA